MLPSTSPNGMEHIVDEMLPAPGTSYIAKLLWEEAAASGAPDGGATNGVQGDAHDDWRLNVT